MQKKSKKNDKKEGTDLTPDNTVVTNIENQVLEEHKNFKEIFERVKKANEGLCPIRDVIAGISDKWSILSILALGGYGKLRFNELKKEVGYVSQRMLTLTLRNLETYGVVIRTIYAEMPPRVEYQLTSFGVSLLKQVSLFADWGNLNPKELLRFKTANKSKASNKIRIENQRTLKPKI